MTKETGPERIQEDLLPLAVDINSPMLDPRNARAHPEENLDQIKLSLLRYGQCKPVVVNQRTGVIEAGNGMVEAARGLGWRRIAVTRADHDENDALGYGLMDNKSGLSSAWDLPNLKDVLEELDTGAFDMRATGFSEAEIEELMTQTHEPPAIFAPGTGPGALMARFIAPPFSILDSRQGYWQERKRLWLSLGLKSEVGRGEVLASMANAFKANKVVQSDSSISRESVTDIPAWAVTSIFDPVLCELVYTWFCPVNGAALDPFAGGSVRGIVSAYCGRSYTGVELRAEQVDENYKQAADILQRPGATVPIKVSGKWARHSFRCDPEYITTVCGGRCCEGTDRIMISLTPEEENRHKAAGREVIGGLLQPHPETGKCPYKQEDGLCSIHDEREPFGCIASPFTINSAGTLIIRYRYTKLRCHNAEGGEPAYKTFRASLNRILGEEEAARVVAELEAGAEEVPADIPEENYRKLVYLDSLKGTHAPPPVSPEWLVGDARDMEKLLPAGALYDLVFTCPPYFDLEIYDDDPRDLCNSESYEAFLKSYGEVLKLAAGRLRENRFAVLVVSEIRDKAGYYRHFIADTTLLAEAAGLRLYNDAVLVNMVGTASVRANRYFSANRKLVKTHQSVLVFYKGDPELIRQEFPEVVVAEFPPEELPDEPNEEAPEAEEE